MPLDEEFIKKCRDAFGTFDSDGSGTIDSREMKKLFEAIGENPSDEEVSDFMNSVDEDGTGEVDFAEFLTALEKTRDDHILENEREIFLSFLALGGNADKTGHIDANIFKERLTSNYGLTINIDSLLNELDKDKDGSVGYDDFVSLFVK